VRSGEQGVARCGGEQGEASRAAASRARRGTAASSAGHGDAWGRRQVGTHRVGPRRRGRGARQGDMRAVGEVRRADEEMFFVL
jgi:hypothetical protein